MKKSVATKIFILTILLMSFSAFTVYANDTMEDEVSTIKSSGEDYDDGESEPIGMESEPEVVSEESEEYEADDE